MMKSFVVGAALALGVVLAGTAPAGAGPSPSEIDHPSNLGSRADDVRTLAVSIPHRLERAEARRRLMDAISGLERDYGFLLTLKQHSWDGYHFHFHANVMGQPAVGRIDVTKDHVNLRVLLPSSLDLLADMAQPILLKQGTSMLAKK